MTKIGLAIFIFAVFITGEVAASETNVMCPVLTDRAADADITSMYKGKEVRFCCNECKMEFEENPEVYLKEIPQLQDLSWRESISAVFTTHTRFIVCGSLVAVLVLLRTVSFFSTPVEKPQSTVLNRRISPTIPLAIVCGILGLEVWSLRQDQFLLSTEDNIHFATFYDFGFPPTPARPAIEETRVAGTYYRGNDERSPKLFNNGNYRTSTFHIALCDESGQPIVHGDQVKDQPLFVRLQIDRPPFTPDFLYDESVMSKMFLTAQCDGFLGKDGPVEDRVNLTTIEPMQKWDALFPIGKLNCCESSRGVIYICEEYYAKPHWWTDAKQRYGSRFHYGISFDLNQVDGLLAADSEVYMGALYRTRKFPTWKLPMTEWFSHEPIPELPGPNVEDSELLGIDDHIAKHE